MASGAVSFKGLGQNAILPTEGIPKNRLFMKLNPKRPIRTSFEFIVLVALDHTC